MKGLTLRMIIIINDHWILQTRSDVVNVCLPAEKHSFQLNSTILLYANANGLLKVVISDSLILFYEYFPMPCVKENVQV